ncbi:methyltransferase [bacterium]|nr:methyltransferase [bacterium]
MLAAEVAAIASRAHASRSETARERGGVALRAPAPEAARLVLSLNLESRLAQRVLWRVAEGGGRDEDDLYDLARGVRWNEWITPRQALRVDVTARHSPLRSLRFAGLRVKDAVCDLMRERSGSRPDVSLDAPDLPILLHLDGESATLYVDTSGEALFKRGWRARTGDAPLKETLAAALLAAAGWDGSESAGPLLDPFCGAGTIAIEAAQLARDMAPGAGRRFAFEKLGPFRGMGRDWLDLLAAARDRAHAPSAPVFASDVSRGAVAAARENAARAGVDDAIEFAVADATARPSPGGQGTIVTNPPFGERIAPSGARAGEGGGFAPALAAHWKRDFAGWTAWVLSPDPKLPTTMRLEASRRVPLWNGPIECRLFRFEMVRGSNRRRRVAEDAPLGGWSEG